MFPQIENDLKELENKFVNYLLTPNKPTNQILEHIFSSGGKRIRPALFLLCCQILNYDGEFKFPIAAVCEYIHTASLLHDDVIDNSTLRRNKPTVNSVWGDETAVLSGDLIYSTACRLMVKTRNLELIDCFAECIRYMSESELYQLELLWNSSVTSAQYEKVVHGKTAYLFEASCKTPALLKNSSIEVCTLLSEFGKNLGFAFQIADDCLDYSGEQNVVGKPVATDLLEGKITLPLIFALQKNNEKLNFIVHKIFETGEAIKEEKEALVYLVNATGGLQAAINKAEEYSFAARKNLEQLEKFLGPSINRQAVNTLSEITFFALKRKM
ncbi:MAG: polyprenyl synthetase family protein [Bdellovibrionota bacterium]